MLSGIKKSAVALSNGVACLIPDNYLCLIRALASGMPSPYTAVPYCKYGI